jgi:XTP/dITP diphosphohydrolase
VYKTIGYQGVLRLLKELADSHQDRSAHFKSCIACLLLKDKHSNQQNDNNDLKIELFKGICNGSIANEGRGEYGFGFDPIFIPDENESHKTFAEMETEEKNQYSHRGKATQLFQQYIAED